MVSLIRHIDHEAFKHLLSCLFASTIALKAVSSTDLIRELFNVLSPSNPSFYITVYICLHNPRPHNEFKLWSSRTWWSSKSRTIKVVQPSRRSHPRRQPNLVLKKFFTPSLLKQFMGWCYLRLQWCWLRFLFFSNGSTVASDGVVPVFQL